MLTRPALMKILQLICGEATLVDDHVVKLSLPEVLHCICREAAQARKADIVQARHCSCLRHMFSYSTGAVLFSHFSL